MKTQYVYPFSALIGQERMKCALLLNATEDRVVGGMDFEAAVRSGKPRFQPGLLAQAHPGILYVDEVNLLDDHLVDIIPDASASGENVVEREGISCRHPARFILVDTMNPEEGELRPQLLDRFGLCVRTQGIQDLEARVVIMERRTNFDEDPQGFCMQWEDGSRELSERIRQAMALYPRVSIGRPFLLDIASCRLDVGVDGHRGDIIMLKTAKTIAAYEGRVEVSRQNIDLAAELALPHRVRRQPLQEIAVDVQSLRLAKG
jgi:magnesium chelatase subunit I